MQMCGMTTDDRSRTRATATPASRRAPRLPLRTTTAARSRRLPLQRASRSQRLLANSGTDLATSASVFRDTPTFEDRADTRHNLARAPHPTFCHIWLHEFRPRCNSASSAQAGRGTRYNTSVSARGQPSKCDTTRRQSLSLPASLGPPLGPELHKHTRRRSLPHSAHAWLRASAAAIRARTSTLRTRYQSQTRGLFIYKPSPLLLLQLLVRARSMVVLLLGRTGQCMTRHRHHHRQGWIGQAAVAGFSSLLARARTEMRAIQCVCLFLDLGND